jgi:hypothetical protein
MGQGRSLAAWGVVVGLTAALASTTPLDLRASSELSALCDIELARKLGLIVLGVIWEPPGSSRPLRHHRRAQPDSAANQLSSSALSGRDHLGYRATTSPRQAD